MLKKIYSSAAILFLGGITAQLISFVALPFITRLYVPSDFGLYSIFSTVLMTAAPMMSLTYNTALPMCKKHEIKALTSVSVYLIIISLFITELSVLFIYAFGLLSEDVYTVIACALLSACVFSCLLVYNQADLRKKRYRKNAIIATVQSATNNSLKLIFSIGGSASWKLILGHSLAIVIALALQSYSWLKLKGSFVLSGKKLKVILSKYVEFPKYRFPEVGLASIAQGLPIYALAFTYPSSVVGTFALARFALGLPVSLVGKAFGDVLYREIFDVRLDKNLCRKIIFNTVTILTLLALIEIVTIWLFGPKLFALFFGEEWIESGKVAKYVALWLGSALIMKPIVNILPVFNLQKSYLYFTINSFLAKFIIVVLLSIFASDYMSVIIGFCATSAIVNLFMVTYFSHKVIRYGL